MWWWFNVMNALLSLTPSAPRFSLLHRHEALATIIFTVPPRWEWVMKVLNKRRTAGWLAGLFPRAL